MPDRVLFSEDAVKARPSPPNTVEPRPGPLARTSTVVPEDEQAALMAWAQPPAVLARWAVSSVWRSEPQAAKQQGSVLPTDESCRILGPGPASVRARPPEVLDIGTAVQMTRGDGDEEPVVGLDGCAERAVDASRVASARQRLLSGDETARLSELFRLLGDPTRVRILYALAEAGELCVCDLAATVDAPDSSVSHALRLLRTARIVRNRRDGRMVYYNLDDAHVRLLLDLSAEHLRHESRS